MRSINKSDRPEKSDELFVAKFDGKKTKTISKLYKKIADRLNFPDHFGNNLDALADCLCDLSWIENPNVKLFIKNMDDFLSKENEETKATILEIFNEAASNQMEEDNSFEVIAVLDN